MSAIKIDLPWPPSLNHYWRHVVVGRSARVLVSARGQRYRREVMGRMVCAGSPRLEGRLAAVLVASPPDRRARDIDNACKAILDAMAHARVYADDAQIDALAIVRAGVVPEGSMRVVVVEASGAGAPEALGRALGIAGVAGGEVG